MVAAFLRRMVDGWDPKKTKAAEAPAAEAPAQG